MPRDETTRIPERKPGPLQHGEKRLKTYRDLFWETWGVIRGEGEEQITARWKEYIAENPHLSSVTGHPRFGHGR